MSNQTVDRGEANPDTSVENFDVEAVNASGRTPLYKAREKIHPKRAYGFYRSLKWWIMGVTLLIYYVTPWLRWDRGMHAPDQAVLIDMANRRFYFFFIEIWPQEFFYVAGLLVMAGIGLFLVTSVAGRAWCGYTCPQTVWVDLFLAVERFFEGDRNARIRLDKTNWTAAKVYKRMAKHSVWLLIAIGTGGAWVFYFADAPTLLVELVTGQAAFVAYATVAILSATTYVFGGLIREQVCIYMCPWPRVQAAMLDTHSLTVTYNDWRGEPRGRHLKRKTENSDPPRGDCVDCNACVAVCPMGIDIRDGQQLECISCALCIDACNAVMEKIDLPKGLISYATWSDYNHNRTQQAEKNFVAKTLNPKSVLRPRTLLYFGIYALLGLGLLASLMSRSQLHVDLSHNRNPLFVQLSDGSIRNGIQLKIRNMANRPRHFSVTLDGLHGATIKKARSTSEGQDSLQYLVKADQTLSTGVFVITHNDSLDAGNNPFSLVVRELSPVDGSDPEVFITKTFFAHPKAKD